MVVGQWKKVRLLTAQENESYGSISSVWDIIATADDTMLLGGCEYSF